MDPHFTQHGFLPHPDPLTRFPESSPFASLDDLGKDLPSLLVDGGFRARARTIKIPPLPGGHVDTETLRLYYVRVAFLASAYINQVGVEPVHILPENIARPLCDVTTRLNRPPILSYDGYALYNWKRFDPNAPIALGNIDTIQNFVHLYDEHWFILVHVEIEAIAARVLSAINSAAQAMSHSDRAAVCTAISTLGRAIWDQVAVLRRIPEHMDPALYYRTFRPYIRFFEDVVYEGVDQQPLSYRGETGAQSSVVPTLVAFFKIPHRPSSLMDHLADMRRFMPAEHRQLINEVEAMPDPRPFCDKVVYNNALEALATFRETHLGFAQDYIASRVTDPRGTGGTPYMTWLAQLVTETRAHQIP